MSGEKGPACRQAGQTLLELIMVVAIAVIVVGALVFATIASLRNAQFAKNQAQATKLAQEGLEKVRSLRDRDTPNSINYLNGQATKFSELWSITMSCTISFNNCYFLFNSSGVLQNATSSNFEIIPPGFQRQFLIEDESGSGNTQKRVTSRVTWTDFSGIHESRLITILRKI